MTINPQNKRSDNVRAMFTRIAKSYDLMNRLMSGGRDLAWRRRLLRKLTLSDSAVVLDLGAGTGDLSNELQKLNSSLKIMAADFTLGMLTTDRDWHGIPRVNADAQTLPFQGQAFDALISGFLVRNVEDVDQALREMARAIKPGGSVGILDMTRPRKNLLTPIINFFLNRIVPLMGALITGQKEAYTYLPNSTQTFLSAEELAEKMSQAGFVNVHFEVLNFGTVAIHYGVLH